MAVPSYWVVTNGTVSPLILRYRVRVAGGGGIPIVTTPGEGATMTGTEI
jgi:hypothetical protein